MTTTLTAEERFEVRAGDGTPLAVWTGGAGPPMVLVHGSMADHTTLDPFVEVARTRWATYALDRRGFGASGDASGYDIEREFEDVAAVVEAVARRTGEPVLLWGHSYGAGCALGGAGRTANVHHLVLYEPGLGLQYPPGSIEAIEAALARGDRDAALVAVLSGVLEMGEDEIAALRAAPLWPVRLAAAHTIPRECWAEHRWDERAGRLGAVTVPTLLLAGSESPPAVAAATRRALAAVPHAQVHVLDGHGHFAHKTDPAMVAGVVASFTG